MCFCLMFMIEDICIYMYVACALVCIVGLLVLLLFICMLWVVVEWCFVILLVVCVLV